MKTNKNILDIAGIKVLFEGKLYDYPKYRFRNYFTESEEYDVKISYKESERIPEPSGELSAKKDYRFYRKTEESYINHDYLELTDNNTALIVSDKNWKNISAELSDVEDFGGATFSIRLFNMLGEIMKSVVIKEKGFVVHSSSLAYKNNGILFSANSGTGKSTHTGLWEKVYGNDVEIINDDMPVVRKINGVWNLCGTPWSGKSERNINKTVPLKGIVFLERGEKNEISPLPVPQAILRIMQQTYLPVYKELMNEVMDNISEALSEVPCYILKCNISEEAPRIVKEGVLNEN